MKVEDNTVFLIAMSNRKMPLRRDNFFTTYPGWLDVEWIFLGIKKSLRLRRDL